MMIITVKYLLINSCELNHCCTKTLFHHVARDVTSGKSVPISTRVRYRKCRHFVT